uniref:Major facilitator superfamily associated domain-containing protein n=1 Tax=Leersia perrieri TaxID=77586 RepID=A0A0D9X0R5_9ORYZ
MTQPLPARRQSKERFHSAVPRGDGHGNGGINKLTRDATNNERLWNNLRRSPPSPFHTPSAPVAGPASATHFRRSPPFPRFLLSVCVSSASSSPARLAPFPRFSSSCCCCPPRDAERSVAFRLVLPRPVGCGGRCFVLAAAAAASDAAVVMLSGQLADGFTTIFVGELYRWIAYVSIALGSCFVVVFLFGTKEPGLNQHCQNKRLSRISWTHWFKKVLYYQVALVYMFTRLVTNVSQALLAFYVINDLEMHQSSKALVPAIIYVCSLVVSVVLQETRWSSWRLKNYFSAGAMLWILSGVGIVVLPSRMHNFMYALSITIGVANALMTVTSISMEGVLVGEDLNGCAFVYGSLSFVDKVSCGIALYILESYQGSTNTRKNLDSSFGYSVTRLGLGLVPAACSLLSAIIAYTMDLPDTRRRPLYDEPLLA